MTEDRLRRPPASPLPDADALQNLRALVDLLLPARVGRPGGLDLRADVHVVHALEHALAGSIRMLSLVLDMYARGARRGARFCELSRDEQEATVRLLVQDEQEEIRDAIEAVFLFALGGYYSEGFEPDATGRGEQARRVWERMGYRGPRLGHAGRWVPL